MKFSPRFYLIVLGISFVFFILEVFIIRLDGAIGLTICLLSTYLIIGIIIRLLRFTNLINDNILKKMDILFF